jgi:tetratricopeptide (TPR) repeat protein
LGDCIKATQDAKFVIDNADSSLFSNKLNVAGAYNILGFVEYKQGDNSTALKYIEKSLSLMPENSYAYRNKALIFIDLHQKIKACEALNKAKTLKFLDSYGDEVDKLIGINCK